MARSPFQGTWQQGVRPTIVTAPDGIVYINGQSELMACNSCRRRFDLNRYITSVQVDLSVENAPGSANVSLSIPRHTVDDFFVDGVPIVSPMMEIEIYAKGYYLVNGMPQYYPIFWGLVTEVSDNYSSGEHTVSINCADILKWWELCRLNVTPAFTQAGGQLGRDFIHGNVFHGANVYDVMWTLAQQSFGDVVQAKGSLVSATRESRFAGTFNGLRRDIMAYWNLRFGQMRSNLLLYGVEGAAVRGDVIYASQPTANSATSRSIASQAVRTANGGEVSSQLLFDPTTNVAPFRWNIANSGNVNYWQSEFQTKLELANVCKEAVGFEFFMDVTGDIVFKPPFYNLDILSNKPVSWIQDVDIIDWNLSESESEVVTQLEMSGSYDGGAMDHGVTSDFNTPTIQVTDYHLLRQYGWRVQSANAEYLNSPEAMFFAGLDMLDRINSRRHRSTVTIPMRPELRLGFPVYLAPKDQVWYLSGISHSLTFGGRAQTQLTLTARRGKFIAPKGIGSIETKYEKPASANADPLVSRLKPTARELSQFGKFHVKVGDAAETPPTNLQAKTFEQDPYEPLVLRHPKTGRIVGYPNVNMAYTRPFNPDSATFKRLAGQNADDKRKAPKLRNRQDPTAAEENQNNLRSGLVQNEARRLTDRHLDNRYIYGMTSAGVYTYVYDKDKVIQEIIQVPIARITVSSEAGTSLDQGSGTATLRPVSDERGFEVIGHYRYGRGISLRDGSLVLNNGERNRRAIIDTQLALAGGLFQTLQTQSQGLTTLSSSYGNPADTVARMAPTDLQTALNPEAPSPEFAEVGKNFVDVAPLNSPANRGQVASIEASQLSRALTVAEMGVKDEATLDKECACLLGRSDLAFINVGYQVQFLKGTAADNTSQATLNLERQLIDAQRQLDDVNRQIASSQDDPLVEIGVSPVSAELLARQGVLERRIQELQAQLQAAAPEGTDPATATASTLGTNVPIAGTTTLELGDVVSKVEIFLQNLYEALDTPHQAYEDALRGKLIPGPTRAEGVSSNERKPEVSPFSPPFSAPNRAVGGDPAALALQGSSALADLSQSWKDFGDNLRREPQRAALSQEIDQAQDKLRRLDAEETRMRALRESESTFVGSQTINARLESLQEERSKTQQQLNNAQLKLRQLEAQP